MSLKRHPALQPLSRDHLIALYHAQQLIKIEAGTIDSSKAHGTILKFLATWKREVKPHFEEEEQLFVNLPIKQESITRLLADHNVLRGFVTELQDGNGSPQLCGKTGRFLDEHVRWEEHLLFPEIEETLDEEQLATLGDVTAEIERNRQRELGA